MPDPGRDQLVESMVMLAKADGDELAALLRAEARLM
jgi:hypothetical protein